MKRELRRTRACGDCVLRIICFKSSFQSFLFLCSGRRVRRGRNGGEGGVGPRTFRQERELVDQTLSLLTFAKVLLECKFFTICHSLAVFLFVVELNHSFRLSLISISEFIFLKSRCFINTLSCERKAKA